MNLLIEAWSRTTNPPSLDELERCSELPQIEGKWSMVIPKTDCNQLGDNGDQSDSILGECKKNTDRRSPRISAVGKWGFSACADECRGDRGARVGLSGREE